VGIILTAIPQTHVLPFDMIGITLSTVMLSYAILRFELMDIQIVIKRSLIYTLFVLCIMILFVILGFLSTLITQKTMPSPLQPNTILLAMLLALVWQYLYTNQQKMVLLLEEERKLKEVSEGLVMIASHNLRTPLTAIHAYVEDLGSAAAQLSPEQKKSVLRLQQSTDRLTEIVDRLLTLPQLKEHRIEHKEKMALNQLVEFTFGQYKDRAAAKQIELKIQNSPETLTVRGDKFHLQQALNVLMDNALKYTTQGVITIMLHRQGNFAAVGVSDTGCGIAKPEQSKLFAEFSQVGGYKRQWEGLGIGLYIVKCTVEAHGGQVTVDSKPGKGSCFQFTLPLVA
jgi:signal transduction histidine kinase